MEYGIPVAIDTPAGTLSFNVGGAFRLTGFDLGAAVRSSVESVPTRDGSIVLDAFRNGATPILSGQIKADTLPARALALDDLRSKLASILRADGTLRWTPSGQAERRLVVRLLEDVQIGGDLLKNFQIALVSARPYAEAAVEQSLDSTALTLGGAGGWSFPFSFPISFGDPSASGEVVVTNGGNVDAYPVVRIYGQIGAPTLRNVTTGEALSLVGLSLSAGDYAEIDMRAETILLNGTPENNLIGSLDPVSSDFFALAPGPNDIRLSAATFDGSAKARVLWRDAWA